MKRKVRRLHQLICCTLSFFVLFSASILIGHNVSAQSQRPQITVTPSSIQATVGERITVSIAVDTPEIAFNTVESKLGYSTEFLEFESVATTGTVISIWTTRPELNGDYIEFAGGLPAPGYKGNEGKLFTATFRVKSEGIGRIFFTKTRLLANDGQATEMNPLLGFADIITAKATPSPTAPQRPPISGATLTPTPSPTPTPTPILGPNGEVLSEEDIRQLDSTLEAPNIEEYSEVVGRDVKVFFIKGATKYQNAQIIITKLNQSTNQRNRYSTRADNDGKFEYTAAPGWAYGKHSLWVEAVLDDGRITPKSEEKEFEVIEKKSESIMQTVVDVLPVFFLFVAFIAMNVQLIRIAFRNKKIKKEMKLVTANDGKENQEKEKKASTANNVEQRSEPDPRMKDH